MTPWPSTPRTIPTDRSCSATPTAAPAASSTPTWPNCRTCSGCPASHCYEFFAGTELFTSLHDADPGTFYLTDFLAKHFDALVWQALGLDRHPELRDAYFGNYSRVVLFSQSIDPAVVDAGRAGAERLGLAFEHHHVGLDHFADAVTVHLRPTDRSVAGPVATAAPATPAASPTPPPTERTA